MMTTATTTRAMTSRAMTTTIPTRKMTRTARAVDRARARATRVPIDELRETTKNAIRGIGYDEKDAEVILDVLMFAQVRGNNQGIIKVTHLTPTPWRRTPNR